MESTKIQTGLIGLNSDGSRAGSGLKTSLLPHPGEPARLGRLVASSQKMREVMSQLAALAVTDLPVLIEGGPGAGKRLAALTLSEIGAWSRLPHLEIDLGTPGPYFDQQLPEIRALARRSRGTLVLKSVEVLSPDRQRALVQLIDEIAPEEGGTRLRLIATSQRQLRAEVGRGRFRADLYYRLRGALVRLPGLAERPEDLPVLIAQLFKDLGFDPSCGRPLSDLCAEAAKAWSGNAWSGNVGELKARLTRWIETVGPDGKPEALEVSERPAPGLQPSALRTVAESPSGLRDYRRREERALVVEALEGTRWNVSAAARGLGLSRVGLSKKMKVLGLVRPASQIESGKSNVKSLLPVPFNETR